MKPIPPSTKPAPARLRLRVTAAAESILRSGHPWLFADSIREQNRAGELGELAAIYDRKDKFLAVGLFDPDSPIRVRILHAGKPQAINQDWWRAQLAKALDRRRGLFDDQTTGYRCINGESDGWPGLVMDRYDTTLVLKLYTAAWLPRLEEIVDLIANSSSVGGTPPKPQIVLRLSRNIQEIAKARFKRSDGQVLQGSLPVGPVVFLETGLRFEADVLRGQKTGFFLDQRENRRRVETLARGRTVLNAFSFSGGFSLYAVRGGARSVTDLDLSAHALAGAKRNFQLNQSDPAVARCVHETVQADTFEWFQANPSRKFDLVILDPPSLARREAERAGAIRAYGRLAALGIQALNRGGILLAASCSAHVTAEEFFETVRQTAVKSGRKFSELQTTRHAPDHPAKFKEAEYLKAIYLKLF
ncbi:MAG TPA: 23S rRNA (cytosine(2499)-C(5))-methyltransferase [Verrucomicrobiae bacterium]|nr:23S rRNA (cytosine(2499)-C(5))-methyltransferase [Verrucomicrobiae bacterium]